MWSRVSRVASKGHSLVVKKLSSSTSLASASALSTYSLSRAAASNSLRAEESKASLVGSSASFTTTASTSTSTSTSSSKPTPATSSSSTSPVSESTDVSFLTHKMKLKHFYQTVVRGQRDTFSTSLRKQLNVMAALSHVAPPSLMQHINPHRLAALAWKMLNTKETTMTQFEGLLRLASRMPLGRTAPPVQHVAGARDKAWFIRESRATSFALRARASEVATEIERFKIWVEEAENSNNLIILVGSALFERPVPPSAEVTGMYVRALVAESRFKDAIIVINTVMRYATRMSPGLVESSALEFPAISAAVLGKLNITALPTQLDDKTLISQVLNREAIEQGIVAAVAAESYSTAWDFYNLLQRLEGVAPTATVKGVGFDALVSAVIAVANPWFEKEDGSVLLGRLPIAGALVSRGLADGTFSFGKQPGVLDLRQFSDPVAFLVAVRVAFEQLRVGANGTSETFKIRLISHTELLAEKMGAQAGMRVQFGENLTPESQHEVRQMLAQMELISPSDPSVADAGEEAALALREAVKKTVGAVAGANGAGVSVVNMNAPAPLNVGPPDYLLQHALQTFLTNMPMVYEIDNQNSTFVISRAALDAYYKQHQ